MDNRNRPQSSLAQERERAKQILLEIVRLSGGRLRGRERLFCIFYFAHLIYAKRRADRLSEWPIVCKDMELTVRDARSLITELVDEGALKRRRGPDHDYFEDIIYIAPPSEVRVALLPSAVEAIRVAVNFTQGRECYELGRWIRRHSQSMRIADEGEPMNIYIDQLPDCEYDPPWLKTISLAKDDDALSYFILGAFARRLTPLAQHAGRRLWKKALEECWFFALPRLEIGPL